MTIHLGPWPWATKEVDPEAWTNLPINDKTRLTHFGGGVPFLGYSFPHCEQDPPPVGNYKQSTWDWLSEHGYRDCVLRLWSTDPLPTPAEYVKSHEEGIARAIRAKMDLIIQPTNEPNLEHASMGAQAFAAWESEVIHLLLAKYPPEYGFRIASSPMAQDAPNTAEWRAAQRPNVARCHYLGWHYYWGRHPGDDKPGAPESPEWAHQQYPDKQIVVSECGSFADKHDVDTVLSRWTGYEWLRSYHRYVLSSPGWPQFNFDDDDANQHYELCKLWREVRAYPLGATPVVPPVVSPGDTMPSIALAIVPSNQSYNVGAGRQMDPPYNEMGGMQYLTNLMLPLCPAKGITAKAFFAPPDPPSSIANIQRAYIDAKAWLDGRPEAIKLCMSLHTDSSGAVGSHTAWCYGDDASNAWGKALAGRVQATLKTAKVLSFDYSDYLFYLLLRPYTSVLMELCAHDVLSNLQSLYTSAKPLASELLDGLLAWAGEAAPSEADTLRRHVEEMEAELTKYRTVVQGVADLLKGAQVAL